MQFEAYAKVTIFKDEAYYDFTANLVPGSLISGLGSRF